MDAHPTRARCSLHVLLVGRDGSAPDPAGLLTVLGASTPVASVAVWAAEDGPDAPTVQLAADLIDRFDTLTGTRPAYLELDGSLADAVGRLGTVRGSIVAVSARAPRRRIRVVRRASAAVGAHLALLPSGGDPSAGPGR